MSNEKMREQFQIAVTERFGKQHNSAFDRFINGDYKRPSIMNLWWAWQASRAALCVELPSSSPGSDGYPKYDAIAVISAIESTGVRTQ